jgi:hypothetical protein
MSILPTDIGGLLLWLKADAGVYNDAGSNLATDTQTVQQWNDQSGNNNHVSQATSSFRPTKQDAEINGKPVVRFDGSDNFMKTSGALGGGNLSIFLVANVAGNTQAVLAQNTPGFIIRRDAVWEDDQQAQFAISIFTGVYDIGSFIFNFTGDAFDTYQNGTLDGNTTSASAVVHSAIIAVGAYDSGIPQWFLNGDVAEVIVYDSALSTLNRQEIEWYLAEKYAISGPTDPTPDTAEPQRHILRVRRAFI